MTLDWQPSADTDALRLRAIALARIRAFLAERGVMEVNTPLLGQAGVTDVHIESMRLAGDPPRYLRTSPEYWHKRLLAAGSGDIYELGPVFRAGEAGRRHNPEFTLLEWYRVGWNLDALMDETVALVKAVASPRATDWPVRRLTWQQAFHRQVGIAAHAASLHQLQTLAPDAPPSLEKPELLDWLFATRVQDTLPAGELTLIHDFPAEHAALARIRHGDPDVAERFELFLGAIELANGYHELADAEEQRRRFERDNRRRHQMKRATLPPDPRLLAAMAAGLPDCCGVALGLDRLLMAVGGASHIGQVLTFDWGRA